MALQRYTMSGKFGRQPTPRMFESIEREFERIQGSIGSLIDVVSALSPTATTAVSSPPTEPPGAPGGFDPDEFMSPYPPIPGDRGPKGAPGDAGAAMADIAAFYEDLLVPEPVPVLPGDRGPRGLPGDPGAAMNDVGAFYEDLIAEAPVVMPPPPGLDWRAIDTALAGPLDDYDFSNAAVLFVKIVGASTMSGLKAGVDGQRLLVLNLGSSASPLTIKHLNTSSASANRINCTPPADYTLSPAYGVWLVYKKDETKWRLVNTVPIAQAINALWPPGEPNAQSDDDYLEPAMLVGPNPTPQYPPYEITFTTTGNIDDLDFSNASLIRMNNASLATIRGLKAGYSGQEVTIVSVGAGQLNTVHQNAGSAAANRLSNYLTTSVTPGAPGAGRFRYKYDATTASWRLIGHDQGLWIALTYADITFDSLPGGSTWTVDSGDFQYYKYYVIGTSMAVKFAVITTTSAGGITEARITPPTGITIGPDETIGAALCSETGFVGAPPSFIGTTIARATTNKLVTRPHESGAFGNVVNLFYVRFGMVCEIQ